MALLEGIRRPGRGSKALPGKLAIGLLLLAGSGDLPAQPAAPAKEYQIKAVFLYNFAQFVEWPAKAFPQADTPLVIGVLGDDPFGTYLDEVVREESANNRRMTVERYRQPEEIKTCHILFISRSESERLEKIFAELKGRSVLTVGDMEGFAGRGGMVRFVQEKNKVRFRINVDAAKAAGLTISSKLLRAAEIIAPGKD